MAAVLSNTEPFPSILPSNSGSRPLGPTAMGMEEFVEVNLGLFSSALGFVVFLSNAYLSLRLLLRKEGHSPRFMVGQALIGLLVSLSDITHFFGFDRSCSFQMVFHLLGSFLILTIAHMVLLNKSTAPIGDLFFPQAPRYWIIMGYILIIARTIPWVMLLIAVAPHPVKTTIGVCTSLGYPPSFLAVVALEILVFFFIGSRFLYCLTLVARDRGFVLHRAIHHYHLTYLALLFILAPIILCASFRSLDIKTKGDGSVYWARPYDLVWVLVPKLLLEHLICLHRYSELEGFVNVKPAMYCQSISAPTDRSEWTIKTSPRLEGTADRSSRPV
ncbi:MAG: hypothetical protein DHS80DRAFT_31246 [Piptocephalis tieghemiana]|nr:MAG: hypothetical protein DHS80DRAFT_31246 [Piptocephalis tieghemiana]